MEPPIPDCRIDRISTSCGCASVSVIPDGQEWVVDPTTGQLRSLGELACGGQDPLPTLRTVVDTATRTGRVPVTVKVAWSDPARTLSTIEGEVHSMPIGTADPPRLHFVKLRGESAAREVSIAVRLAPGTEAQLAPSSGSGALRYRLEPSPDGRSLSGVVEPLSQQPGYDDLLLRTDVADAVIRVPVFVEWSSELDSGPSIVPAGHRLGRYHTAELALRTDSAAGVLVDDLRLDPVATGIRLFDTAVAYSADRRSAQITVVLAPNRLGHAVVPLWVECRLPERESRQFFVLLEAGATH
jgi:hypothetical protein